MSGLSTQNMEANVLTEQQIRDERRAAIDFLTRCAARAVVRSFDGIPWWRPFERLKARMVAAAYGNAAQSLERGDHLELQAGFISPLIDRPATPIKDERHG
jgi:hypothetical protein